MIKNFSLYLALRYLRPKRTFVSVITVISVLGVSFGVWALTVVIPVMAGFHAQIRELAMGYDSHIEAFDRWGTSMMASEERPADAKETPWREVLKTIKSTPGVISASPIVRGLLLIESREGMAPSWMWGMKPEDGNRLADKHKKLLVEPKGGELDLSGKNIIIDQDLARAWNLRLGDKVTVYAPTNLKGMMQQIRLIDELPQSERNAAYDKLKELTLPQDLTITGIISPPRLQDSDKMAVAVVPLHVAQELRDLGDGVTSIGVEVADPFKAGEVKQALLDNAFPVTWEAYTWMEQHAQLFATVQNELEMMYFVLFIIVIVAAFCVMNTMITVTVQKRREIGIILALGAKFGQIVRVFLLQGIIVGFAGALFGLGMGLLTVHFRNEIRAGISAMTGREIFDSSIYGLVEIPAKVLPQDVAIICTGAFLLCTIAALVPAYLAARTEPAVALRD
ncbi:MAG: ABC transporter permease [Roseimicrobium sp.]